MSAPAQAGAAVSAARAASASAATAVRRAAVGTVSPSPRDTGPARSGSTRLEVVARPQARLARGPFITLVVTLLVTGLLGLLLLNTVLAQDAFVLHDLEKRTAVLGDREQALTEELAEAESPEVLAERARRLGMVPGSSPAFLRLDGTVLGEAAPATAPPTPPRADQAAARRARPAAGAGTPAAGSAGPDAGQDTSAREGQQ